ncbi:MAG: PH domain-containing protein [Planctomycetaceae bacterium]|jgi:membrane protein YdbS with pleckstrin-like domain|nr:PH domain-containing protein [Planctomycetaceae bacterium]
MQNEISFDRNGVMNYFKMIVAAWCLFSVSIGLVFAFVPFLLGGTVVPGIFVITIGLGVWFVYSKCIAPWLLPWQMDETHYRLDENTLRVDKGVIFLSRKSIPLDRITDIAFVQGPILRLAGIWEVRVQTAGNSGTTTPEAVMYGIINPEQVRENILSARDTYIKSNR